MTKSGNASRMHKLVEEFRESGLSQKDFAASYGLTTGKMHYWVSKMARPERSAGPRNGFVAISVTPEPEGRNIVIRLKSGVEIEIPV